MGSEDLSTSLTTIRQPIFEMCELAINILLKEINKDENTRLENILGQN